MPARRIIIDKEIPSDIVYADDECLAFRDVNPQAPRALSGDPKKESPRWPTPTMTMRRCWGTSWRTARMLAAQMQLDAAIASSSMRPRRRTIGRSTCTCTSWRQEKLT